MGGSSRTETPATKPEPSRALVLLTSARVPDQEAISAAALRFGVGPVEPIPNPSATPAYAFAGVPVVVMLAPGRPPSFVQMGLSPLSEPAVDLDATKAHLMVQLVGETADVRLRDSAMARIVAALLNAYDGLGAMLGHGKIMHSAAAFTAAVDASELGTLPVQVAVELYPGVNAEGPYVLTRGLARYGRDELWVSHPAGAQADAVDLAYGLATWMLREPGKTFPEGDTVGRSEQERLTIRYVPHPANPEQRVMKLRL